MAKRILKTRLQAAVAASVMTALIVGGVNFASASIPDSQGVIHGCYSTSATPANHALSVINSNKTANCPANTRPLNWSPVTVLSSHQSSFTYFSSSGTTIVSLSVPAGSYAVFGKVSLYNGSSAPTRDACTLSAGSNSDNSVSQVPTDYTTMALQTVNTFTSTGTVTLSCVDIDGAGNQQADYGAVTAISATSAT